MLPSNPAPFICSVNLVLSNKGAKDFPTDYLSDQDDTKVKVNV